MPEQTLWNRTRQAVYDEIARTAMELFLTRGFEATTIDDIAKAAGISRRSFFRYFGTKEDIVLGDLAAQGELAARALAERPEGEDAWTALRNAFHAIKDVTYDADTMLKVSRMMYETPSLRARHIEKHLRWQASLVPELRRRLKADPENPLDVRAEALVACAITCLDVAGEAWTRANGSVPLEDLFDSAAAALRAGPQ
ncbi:TetR family transcriptional regulator [Actinoplanes ianthinogenes]|uniref:TetR family transcriptional regulator n=1 Tax=Actinoplanes ianthinogenes TaxID=122358 RepID=A0ABM7LNK2_9ACTN|nr:TetR family transcriptional regulator [Actinoplanes ianthinogenes]BCJ40851.1 TetR family transcriptional regulator [Actinoplanes ianthinogenes]GGR24778.1 TetR family transcriptional regulator [Actinoplanes ianthinogenes]